MLWMFDVALGKKGKHKPPFILLYIHS